MKFYQTRLDRLYAEKRAELDTLFRTKHEQLKAQRRDDVREAKEQLAHLRGLDLTIVDIPLAGDYAVFALSPTIEPTSDDGINIQAMETWLDENCLHSVVAKVWEKNDTGSGPDGDSCSDEIDADDCPDETQLFFRVAFESPDDAVKFKLVWT